MRLYFYLLLSGLLTGSVSHAASPVDFISEVEAYKGKLLSKATHTVIYKRASGVDLQLYIFIPEDIEENEKRPALLFIHGGGWRKGDVNQLSTFVEKKKYL